MTRSSAAAIVAWAVVGAVGGFLLQTGLALSGLARIQAPWTLTLSLVAIAVVVIILAIPVWRASHGRSQRRIDPFVATRTVLLAKAGAVLGALLAGIALGFTADVLLRPVIADGDALLRTLAVLGASVLLLVAGLVAEQLCTVPPGPGPDDDPPVATGAE